MDVNIDNLPLWNDTPATAAIRTFIDAVTDPAGPNFVPPAERLAVFDHDGTLWCEKPFPIHLYAILDRYRELARANPSRLGRRLWRALTTADHSQFDEQTWWSGLIEPLIDVLGLAFSDMDEDAFAAWVGAWLNRWRHPRFGVDVAGLVYQPMGELVSALQANDFTVAIATADEADFVRVVSQQLYGIPAELVLGSQFGRATRSRGGIDVWLRTYHPDHMDTGAGKRLSVAAELGRQPILAAGNTDGDIPLLNWTAEPSGPSLSILINHTDARREYSYNRGAKSALAAADVGGWLVVDMAHDWETLFATTDDGTKRTDL